MKKFILISLFLSLSLITVSCFKTDQKKLRNSQPQEEPLPKIDKTLIVPFVNMTKIYGTNKIVKSLISGNYFKTGNIDANAADFMTRSLTELAQKSKKFGIIKNASEIYGAPAENELKTLIKQGKAANADIVLAGYIYKFKDRNGADYAADTPASVTFNIYVIDVTKEKILKSKSVVETQQSLTDNILTIKKFLKRSGKWITAKEMAYEELNEMLKELK